MITLGYAGLGAISQVPVGSGSSGASGFACTSTVCYTVGATYSGLFQNFKKLLNLIARQKGYAYQLPTTGAEAAQIGAGTVSLAKQVATKLGYNEVMLLQTLANLEGGPGITKESLAANADVLVRQMVDYVNRFNPAAVGALNIQIPSNPSGSTGPGATPPSIIDPYPNVTMTPQLPATPSVNQYGVQTAPGPTMIVPSAGPQITWQQTPGSAPHVFPLPSGFSPTGAMSPVMIAGVVVLGVGALAAVAYAINKKKSATRMAPPRKVGGRRSMRRAF